MEWSSYNVYKEDKTIPTEEIKARHVDWTNKYKQAIFFTRLSYLHWRTIVDMGNVAKQHEIITFVDPINIGTDHWSEEQYLIYRKVLTDETRVLNLGHFMSKVDTASDKEFTARFTNGYLSTSLTQLKKVVRDMCVRYEREINKEEYLYKFMRVTLEDKDDMEYLSNFFSNARNKIGEYCKQLMSNIKNIQEYGLETKKESGENTIHG